MAPGNYVVNITTNIDLGDMNLDVGFDGRTSEVVISLRGIGAVEINRTESTGPFLAVYASENIILRNIILNNAGSGGNVVAVRSGVFVMEAGSVLTGGLDGVIAGPAFQGSTFIMNGGEIYGNTRRGVSIRGVNHHFEKSAGIVFGNVSGNKSNPTAIVVLDLDDANSIILYRENNVINALSVTLDETGNIASQAGVWSSP